jgi:hypothetical protein
MTLKAKIQDDAKVAFLNNDEFAESITYTPNGGSPKAVKALVVRERLQADGPDQGRVLNRQAEVYVANDATEGVISVDKGNDTVSFPVFVEGSAVSWRVVEVLGKGEGMWHLAVMR